jgi:uncharacterized protein YoxC
MNEIPSLWLWLSGAFFFFATLFMIVLIVVSLQLVKLTKELKPKIESISARVDAIGKNLEELTAHVKVTAESVGGRAQNVAHSVESIAQLASGTFERFSPYVVGAMTAMKLVSGFLQMRRSMAPAKVLDESPKAKRRKG